MPFLAATKQFYEWFSPSVCLSNHPSHIFIMFPSSYHHEIFRSHHHWHKWSLSKRSMSRSKVKVTEGKTQLSRFRTVTPVWIHIWRWNGAQSLWHRKSALLFFKVICQNSRSHRTKKKITNFDPSLAFPDCNSSLNWSTAIKWWHKAWSSIEEVPYCFFKVIHQISRSHGTKNCRFSHEFTVSGL